MCIVLLVIVSFTLLFETTEAQNCTPVTPVIIGSVFGTAGGIFVIVLVLLCILKVRSKKKEKVNPSVPGYDNPLVIAENGERKNNSSHVPVLVETKAQNQTTSLDDNNVASSQKSEDTVRTLLLDQKVQPTNGFDVSCDDGGDIVVSNVRENGPADKKLREGDVIDSITVFFDDITHEDALKLLSNAAAYKVAVTVSEKTKEPGKIEDNPAEIGPLYRDIEKVLDEKLHSNSPILERTFPTSSSETIKPEVSKSIEQFPVAHKAVNGVGSKSEQQESSLRKESGSFSQSSSRSSSSNEGEEITIIQTGPEQLDEEEEKDTDHIKSEATVPENVKTREEALSDTLEFIDEKHDSSSTSSSTEEDSFQAISDPKEEPVSPTSSSDFDKLLDANFSQETAYAPDNSMENIGTDNTDMTDNYTDNNQAQAPSPEPVVVSHSTPLTTPIKKREDIVFTSGWRKVVKLLDLMRANLVKEEVAQQLESGEIAEDDVAKDLHQYLSGSEPLAGVLITKTDTKMSFYEAGQSGLIRRGTAVGLLEAQAATGSIISPYTGEKMSVDDATKSGLIDRQLASMLIRAERAVLGFKSKVSDKPLSLFEAMERKLVVESHGIRLLEAQIATGGIIDPHTNHRLPVEVAFERGLFDQRLNNILEDPSDDTKGFFDPNTNENLSYLELLDRCVVDKETSLNLLPIHPEKPAKSYKKSKK